MALNACTVESCGTKRNVRFSTYAVDPSKWGVCEIAEVGQGSLHRPQNMHFAMSMSKRDITRRRVSLSFFASILMHSIGHARSHAKQAVQMSMSTSRKPRYRG